MLTFWFNRYLGHYDFPCFLVLIGITFTGHIVFASGLCRSVAYDAHIFDDTQHLHPQYDWELNLGDGHFSTCARFLTPVQAIGGRALTVQETTWNEWLKMPRSRIEHINSVVKNHRMFKGEPFRGWVRNLKVFVNVSWRSRRTKSPRSRSMRSYAGFGPWPRN